MNETVMRIVNTYVVPIVTYLATSGVLTAVLVALFKRVTSRDAASNRALDRELDGKILASVKSALREVSGSAIDFDITARVDDELKKLTGNNLEQNAAIMTCIDAMKQLMLDMALHMSNSRSLKPEDKEQMLTHIERVAGVKSTLTEAKKLRIDLKPDDAQKTAVQPIQGAETVKPMSIL